MKIEIALLAFAAVSINLRAAPAVLPAPLPEFLDQSQLVKWNSDQMTAISSVPSASSAQFYTGKPYVAEAGGYVFKYRTYNPEMSRWTSADPSGFPDGANNTVYSASPISNLDASGLLTVTGQTTPSTATDTYTSPQGTVYTITLSNIAAISSPNALTGTLNVTTYMAVGAPPNALDAYISITASGVSPQANVTYHWIQSITTSDPLGGRTSPYLDTNSSNYPYYPGGTASLFFDSPGRDAPDATSSNPVTWESALTYVGYNSATGVLTNYGGVSYGFTITE